MPTAQGGPFSARFRAKNRPQGRRPAKLPPALFRFSLACKRTLTIQTKNRLSVSEEKTSEKKNSVWSCSDCVRSLFRRSTEDQRSRCHISKSYLFQVVLR